MAMLKQVAGSVWTGVASCDEQPIWIFRQFAGGDPSGCDDVSEGPSVAEKHRGSAMRVWHLG